jgi:hypothetical protein
MLVPFVLYIQKKRKNKQQEKGKNQAQDGQSNPASNILTQKSNQLQKCLPVLSVYSCSSSLIFFFFDWKHNYQPVKDPWSFLFLPRDAERRPKAVWPSAPAPWLHLFSKADG